MHVSVTCEHVAVSLRRYWGPDILLLPQWSKWREKMICVNQMA